MARFIDAFRKARLEKPIEFVTMIVTVPGLVIGLVGVAFVYFQFHDLRKTFASLLAQRGVSTAVTQRLLEHSSPKLTNDVYTNVDPALRQAINLLPVAELF